VFVVVNFDLKYSADADTA